MQVIGADPSTSALPSALQSVDLFTSHEGLLLEYEEALTREMLNPQTKRQNYYNTSAHFLWIGDRTRQINGAHVELVSYSRLCNYMCLEFYALGISEAFGIR